MVEQKLNYYCIRKNIILKTSKECLSCDCKNKIVYEDRGYIGCPHCRIAEKLKFNIVFPLRRQKVATVEELIGAKNPKILLVRKGGGMGDIVTTTVTIRGVREKFPDAEIYYHCHEKYGDLLEGNPDLNGIVTKRNKSDDYDLEIELDNPCPCYVYEARNIDKPAGITRPRVDLFCERAGVNPENKMPFIKVSEEETKWVDELFKQKKVKKIKIAIAPTSFESMKSWPIEKVEKLVPKIIKELNATVFILHDKSLNIENTIGIYGFPLRKVVALVNKMDLVISVDTGFIHLTGALGRPLIGLWGVNEPKRVMAYYKNTSWIWKKDKFPCSPCYYLHKCMKFPSPCLDAITPNEVFDEIKKRLSNSGT